MSGQGAAKRRQAQAATAYRLQQQGKKAREIADILGVDASKVAELVRLGERFSQAPPPDTTPT